MEKRLDAIQELNQDSISRDEIREYLNPVYDLERLLSKVTYKTANPRDLIAFRNSLQMLPPIKTVLAGFQKEELAAIREEIDGLEDIYQLIDEAIVEEPPISIREGGMIKDQFDETIDHLRAPNMTATRAGPAGGRRQRTYRNQESQNKKIMCSATSLR